MAAAPCVNAARKMDTGTDNHVQGLVIMIEVVELVVADVVEVAVMRPVLLAAAAAAAAFAATKKLASASIPGELLRGNTDETISNGKACKSS